MFLEVYDVNHINFGSFPIIMAVLIGLTFDNHFPNTEMTIITLFHALKNSQLHNLLYYNAETKNGFLDNTA